MEYILIFITAIFVNNIVLSQFLGICPLSIMYLNEERCAIEKRLRQYMAMQYVFFKHRGLLFADNKAALDAAKAERESHYLVKYLYTNYTQAMFPQIREAWQAEIAQLITQIYKINKPLTRLIKIERIKE